MVAWLLVLLLLRPRHQMLCHGRTCGRAGIGLDPGGKVSLVKLQPFLDISRLFQRVAADKRVTSRLAAIMGDHPVLMPEKSKLNYKQRLAEGGELFGLGGSSATASATEASNDSNFGRFPIHNDYAYYRRQKCPPTALTSCVVLDDCTLENGPLRVWPGTHKHHLEHDPHELGLQVRSKLLLDGTLDPAAGETVLATAGSLIVFQVTTIHASTPNFTVNPRRLCIFAHCPQSLFVPQIHPGNQNAVICEGALEADYLRRVANGTATPGARL